MYRSLTVSVSIERVSAGSQGVDIEGRQGGTYNWIFS